MKRGSWYNVRYFDEDGYFHDDYVRGLKETKRLAKYYKVGFIEVKNRH